MDIYHHDDIYQNDWNKYNFFSWLELLTFSWNFLDDNDHYWFEYFVGWEYYRFNQSYALRVEMKKNHTLLVLELDLRVFLLESMMKDFCYYPTPKLNKRINHRLIPLKSYSNVEDICHWDAYEILLHEFWQDISIMKHEVFVSSPVHSSHSESKSSDDQI